MNKNPPRYPHFPRKNNGPTKPHFVRRPVPSRPVDPLTLAVWRRVVEAIEVLEAAPMSR